MCAYHHHHRYVIFYPLFYISITIIIFFLTKKTEVTMLLIIMITDTWYLFSSSEKMLSVKWKVVTDVKALHSHRWSTLQTNSHQMEDCATMMNMMGMMMTIFIFLDVNQIQTQGGILDSSPFVSSFINVITFNNMNVTTITTTKIISIKIE